MNLLTEKEHHIATEFEQLFPEFHELLQNFFGRGVALGLEELPSWFRPKCETEVNENEVIVRLPCPGCRKEDIEIEAIGDFLTINCRCPGRSEMGDSGDCAPPDSEERCLFRERAGTDFSESLRLPTPVESDQATATYCDGVIEVHLPRQKAQVPRYRRIEIANS